MLFPMATQDEARNGPNLFSSHSDSAGAQPGAPRRAGLRGQTAAPGANASVWRSETLAWGWWDGNEYRIYCYCTKGRAGMQVVATVRKEPVATPWSTQPTVLSATAGALGHWACKRRAIWWEQVAQCADDAIRSQDKGFGRKGMRMQRIHHL